MAKQIIIKPVITEKSDQLTEKKGQYTFVVARDANKIEIKKAVAEMFNVKVKAVNTMHMPSKTKMRRRRNRNTIILGRMSSYKKAVVTLAEGEEINFFGDL